MARTRNIKPGFFTSEDLAELPPIVRLFFIGLWTVADFRGVVEWRPRRLKIQLAPFDNGNLDQWADRLKGAGFLRRFTVQGRHYVKVVNFEKHQHPHKQEVAAGSDLPDVDHPQAVENTAVDEHPNNIGSQQEAKRPQTSNLNPQASSLVRAADAAEPEDGPEVNTRPTDPRKNHPVIIALREVTNAYPPKEIWDELIDQMGQDDINLVKLKQAFTKWRARGYNKFNYSWATDWYVHGIPKEARNGSSKTNSRGSRPTNADRLAEYADVLNEYPSEADLGRIS